MRLALLTHEPFYPPSGGGSAEANYLVSQLTQRGHEVHLFCPEFPDLDAVAARFGITAHPFTGWEMGRYTRLRSIKYLAYPGGLRRLVRRTARDISFDAILSQHAISAVAAGKLKADLGVPVVMNFLDFLTGFMESWPAWAMPRFVLRRLMAYELTLPKRHDADAVLTVSDELARRFAETGYAAERLHPIHYGHDSKLFQPRIENREPRTDYLGTVAMHGSFDTHHLGPIAIRAITNIIGHFITELAIIITTPTFHLLVIQEGAIMVTDRHNRLNGSTTTEIDSRQIITHFASCIADSVGITTTQLAIRIFAPAFHRIVI